MADKDTERTDAEEGSSDKETKRGIGTKDIVIFALSAFLVIGLSVGGTAFYLGTNAQMAATATASVDGEAMDAEKKKGKKKKKKKKKTQDKKMPDTVVYEALDPAFVVNFEENDELHFLQLTVEVMAYENSVIENVKKHRPAIRDSLVILLSKQSYRALTTEKGKEKLRADALATVRNVLKRFTGTTGIEAIYFTSFVMQ